MFLGGGSRDQPHREAFKLRLSILKNLEGAPKVLDVPLHWLYRVFYLSDDQRRRWLARVLKEVRAIEYRRSQV